MDEFPARHGAEPDAEPASWHRAVVVLVVAAIIVTLAALYFYGFSRNGRPDARSTVLAPAPTDTEVAVAVDEPVGPGPVTSGGDDPSAVVAPPEVVTADPVAPAATAERGRLVIRSSPTDALVSLDGSMAGRTPVTIDDLAFGAHEVHVARPGFVPAVETVVLDAGSPSRTLAVELARGAEAVAPATGSLEVDSRPRGATVVLDGRRVGETPLRLPAVTGGSHRVQIELAGYRTIRTEVTVERGRAARVGVTLEPGGR